MVWIGPHQRGQQPLRIGLMNAQRRTTDTPAFLAGRQQGLAVLDGQQRLTSLIYALTAPDLPLKGTKLRRWFFIDLDLLSKDPDHDDIVIERSKRDVADLHSPEAQYQRHLLPCTVLLTCHCSCSSCKRPWRWRTKQLQPKSAS